MDAEQNRIDATSVHTLKANACAGAFNVPAYLKGIPFVTFYLLAMFTPAK